MTSRDAILNRIRTSLASDPPVERPPVPEVWARQNPTTEEMTERFAKELTAVHGEVHRVASMDEARQKLAELLQELEATTLGSIDRPLCRDLVAGLDTVKVVWPTPEDNAPSMANLSAGLVEADCLLADTGSSMVDCGTAQERLMCYLPPACFVIATTDRLAEHLPAAWGEIARRVADPAARGEFVFITGPSRTADIEKILILGVHGPKRLIVLLVG
jgi:L-lactate dehydrogenase complex protein LldG